jgi:hypothetical protein
MSSKTQGYFLPSGVTLEHVKIRCLEAYRMASLGVSELDPFNLAELRTKLYCGRA